MIVFKKLVYEWVLHTPSTIQKASKGRAWEVTLLPRSLLQGLRSLLQRQSQHQFSLDSLIETPCVLEQSYCTSSPGQHFRGECIA